MRVAFRSRGHAFMATALSLALGSRVAFAQSELPAVTHSDPPKAKAATGPLTVLIETRGLPFDKAKLRTSLSHELGREVVLVAPGNVADVSIELDSSTHADVRYAAQSGEVLRRGVDLPPDGERAVQVVSWLTVNLVRDEASELLDELRARRKEEADARAAEADTARAAAEKAAADKAAADKAAADKVAADQAAAEAEKKRAAQAKAAASGAGGPPAADNVGLLRDPLRSLDAAFATPLSLLHDSKKRLLRLQLAIIYGEAGGVEGVAVSPGVLRIRQDLLGAGVGAAATIVGGHVRGAVVAAGFSEVDGILEGVQLGAGAAIHRGPIARGAVLSAGGAFAGNVDGALLGGMFVSSKSLNGVGIAGGATVIRGPSEGVLIAGGANFSADHHGIELAGGVNAARDLYGLALAPVNVHRRVKGLQLGIVNVAEEVDGISIGILSFAKNGRVQPVLWAQTDGSVHVGVKSIAGWAFTEIGGGVDVGGASYSYDGGVGLHARLSQNWFLEPGVHYSGTNKTVDASGSPDAHQLHYLCGVGYRVGDKLDLLAAVGVRHTLVGSSDPVMVPEARGGIAFF